MIVIAGDLILHPDTFPILQPAMTTMIAKSRAETGCLNYTYARDILDPETIRVHELWQDRKCLEAHLNTDHLRDWRAILNDIGIVKRQLTAWQAGESWVF